MGHGGQLLQAFCRVRAAHNDGNGVERPMGKAGKNILADLPGQAAVVRMDDKAHGRLFFGIALLAHESGVRLVAFQRFGQKIAGSALKLDKGVVQVGRQNAQACENGAAGQQQAETAEVQPGWASSQDGMGANGR